MILLSALIISMIITIALVPFTTRLAAKFNALDRPGGRRIHELPTPKSGGVAMALGAITPVLLWAPVDPQVRSIIIGGWMIIVFGVADDFKELGSTTKLVGQIAAALVVIVFGGLQITHLDLDIRSPMGQALPQFISIPLTLVVIVGATNAINLSDGLDGLAGGICLLSFVCIGYLAFQTDNLAIAVLAVSFIGAILGFLQFNTYPATIFMGDSGSQLLGFLMVTLSLAITQSSSSLSPILPLLMMGVPILDTCLVMFERIREGKSPFHADNKHIHHRLLHLGLFHTESVLVIYSCQALLISFGFVFRSAPFWFLATGYLVFSVAVIALLSRLEQRQWRRKKDSFLDASIKSRLRVLKEKKIFIKVSFKGLEKSLPLMLLITCFIPRQVESFLGLFTALFLICILAIWILKRQWVELVSRIALYLVIPYVIYSSERVSSLWYTDIIKDAYHLCFGIMVLLAFMTLKLTRRKKGFKSTTLDFLVVFIALVIPNLPDQQIQSYQLGMISAKIIGFYFSYEVLVGEFREKAERYFLASLMLLLSISIRCFFGI